MLGFNGNPGFERDMGRCPRDATDATGDPGACHGYRAPMAVARQTKAGKQPLETTLLERWYIILR